MNPQPTQSGTVTRPVARRSFLALMGLGPVVATAAACSGGSNGSGTGSGSPTDVADDILPRHIPLEYAEPDFPSVNGSTPGYISMPDLVRAYDSPPGSGSTFTAMTPLWGTIPPTDNNQYFDAVSEAMGSTLRFQISDGNTYGERLATVLASPNDVPDWVSIPTWNVPPRFDQAVEGLFEDLTPFLSGDNVADYPHLANIPTDIWRFCIFDGQIKAIPFPGEPITDAIFYRADLLRELGITPDIGTAEELRELLQELTGGNTWGANDMWTASTIIHGVVPDWTLDDAGNLVHRYETEEYRAALAWNASLYADGSIHPDAVADGGDAKQRFESGSALFMSDGVGGWHEALTRQASANPDYDQQPLAPFGADGGVPVLFKGNPANIFSFIKQNEDKDLITELLTLADFLASPFGTEEFHLINYGVQGLHYDNDEVGLPAATELAGTEVQPTYTFLGAPPVVNARLEFPQHVEDFCTWMADAMEHVHDPLFFGTQITEPSQFSALSQPFEDLEPDIARGRRDLSDLDTAIETWRSSGGEDLREFYQEILEHQG